MLLQCSLFQRSLSPGDTLRGLLTFSPPETGLSSKMWGGGQITATTTVTTQDTWRVEVVGVMDGMSKLGGAEGLKGFTKRADGGFALFSAEHGPVIMDSFNLSYFFSLCLPESLPPTYRGSAVKFSYVVVVEALRKQQCIASLKIPLRIRLTTKEGFVATLSNSIVCPLTVVCLNASDPIEVALPVPPSALVVEAGDSKCVPGLFKVSQTDEEGLSVHVVSLLLSTQAIRSGGQLQGLLDFTGAEIMCSRVELSLKMKELHGSAVVSSSLYHTQIMNVNMCLTSNFSIVLPKLAPPSLECALLTVVWEIELKFTVTANVLLWCLPITVLARSERANLVTVKSALIP